MRHFLSLLLFTNACFGISSGPSCHTTSQSSNEDFFVALKSNNGAGLYLFDESSSSFTGPTDLTGTDSAVAKTLAALYSNSSEIGYIMYNDEFPDGRTSDSYGHTKGVAVFGSDHGFWLVHSTPRWPPNRADGYAYPTDEQKYGQSFLCLSMTAAELDTVAKCFFNNKAHVYDGYIPASLTQTMPSMTSAITGQHTTDSVATQQSISAGSSSWTQFCKSSEWGKDLYEDLVEPYFSAGFSWETWQNGGHTLPGYCAGQGGCSYDSFNVKTVSMPDGTNWDINQDHSKWGVSTTGSISCIGDINRETTQRKRGGGTVCRDNAALHTALSSIITDTDKSCGSC